jgi:serine/threonine protein kinase
MTLSTGTRLGPYEVLSRIGAGGMGEVYRARDTTLPRDVAIKVLLPTLANDPDRLARFSREAQWLASLNHPNIAHIHGLADADGVRAIVMELVEGPTLADRLVRGPIPLNEALTIAKQIADALEAAHEHGIIHRDLKPANIKVRPDGIVKVLDFGLAKALDPQDATSVNATMSPTMSVPATEAGVILGTAAYMAPEQARGHTIERYTDIWAFGCVLYEMLTGRSPFEGGDLAGILARVLEREPDWTRLPANVPARVRDLLRLCLEKNPKNRRRDAGDVRIDIERALSGPAAETIAAGAARASRVAWLVIAVAILAAVVLTIPRDPLSALNVGTFRTRNARGTHSSSPVRAARVRAVAQRPIHRLRRVSRWTAAALAAATERDCPDRTR